MFILEVLTQQKVYLLDKTFYYLSNEDVKKGIRVEINFHGSHLIGFVTNTIKEDLSEKEIEDKYGFAMKFIEGVIDDEPIIDDELFELAKTLKEHYFYTMIGTLQAMLPPSLKPKNTLYKAPKIKYLNYYKITELLPRRAFTKNERKILDRFANSKLILQSEFSKSKTLESLIEDGIILKVQEEVNRYKINKVFNDYETKITLSDEQENAYKQIIDSKNKVFLLKGVTGSGKTEVYIKLIEKTLKDNKGALILVPEIALTPLMISRLLSYFNETIAVLHSSLSDGQKYDEYRKISRGEAKIVVGTRSAIFAPIKNLGIIIIDEENDECYKQDEQGLLYNAKDVALIRIKNKDAKLILGSATPQIETMARAEKGLYELVELKNRYNEVPLPRVHLIPSNDYHLYSINSSVFSLPLIKAIKEKLFLGEQIILLINSRGYGKYYKCRECGYTYKCPNCDLPLFYHKGKNILYCHHCEYKIKVPKTCSKCGSKYFDYGSFGIEKVEEDFKKIFNVPYLVLDSDRTPKTLQIETILKDFNEKKANVLIGTQIVSKGHDFKNVSLVAVLNADSLLNFPSYRSKEMTFSLITQTIGRCGRDKKQGDAYIQTSNANNYAIIDAINQDYDTFFEHENNERKLYKNPPFMNLLSIDVNGSDAGEVNSKAKEIKEFIKSYGINDAIVLGPSELIKKGIKFKKQVFIKYKKLASIKEAIEDTIDTYKSSNKISIRINLNPYNF